MNQFVEVEVYAERKRSGQTAEQPTEFSEQYAKNIRKAVLDDLKKEYPEIESTEYESDISMAEKGFYLTVRFEIPTEIEGRGEDAVWTTPDRDEWADTVKEKVEKHTNGNAACYVTDNMTEDYDALFERCGDERLKQDTELGDL